MTRQPLISSFKNAAAGIRAASRERNFRIELCFAVAAIILGIGLNISTVEWAVVSALIGIVLSGECINTSLEAVVDLASPEYHELAKIAKDAAAGAVLVSSVAALFVAAFVYLPKIIALFIA